MTEELKPCPDALLPDGPTCPRCGQERGPSGVDGGSWVHYRRPPAPADAPQAGRVVEPPYLPSYGKIPWDRLKAAVDDAVGCTQKWDGEHYIGHQTAPINMNSLNRIVSGFVAEATPPSAPADAPVGLDHPNSRLLFKDMCDRCGIVLGVDNVGVALEKIKLATRPRAAPPSAPPAADPQKGT